MKSNYKKLGQFIQQVSIKNSDLRVDNLLGVSITKEFIKSIANTIGTDMTTYKIVKKNQFTYGSITSRNGDKISIALLQEDEAIVSTSYTVFEVIDINELLPEYLMMWFRRPEFDRYARYMSHGSTREAFGWEEMCDVELPVPTLEKQKEIIKEYHTITDRIKLNEQLNQKLEDTAQSIYTEWFVNFEFPDENGNPYKSNGGEMVYCDELEIEIPKGWFFDTLQNITSTIDNRGKTPPHFKTKTNLPLIEIGSLKKDGRIIDLSKCIKYLDQKTYENNFRSGHPQKKDILFSTVGSLAESKIICNEKCSIAQNIVAFRSNEDIGFYLYQYLKNSINSIMQYNIGSVQSSIKVSQLVEFKVLIPLKEVVKSFETIIDKVTCQIANYTKEIEILSELNGVLLSKMATIEG
jgi:type I restriction enzyme S subunit